MVAFERTDLLRYATISSEVPKMVVNNKKKLKKINLLEMHDPERFKVLREVREELRLKIAEAKLMQSLLEVENLTVNGNIVYKGDAQLNGFSLLK